MTALPIVGDMVVYISAKGYERPALVIGTPETVQEGHSLPPLEDGALNLLTFTGRGRTSVKFNVPNKELAMKPQFQVDGGPAQAIWKPRSEAQVENVDPTTEDGVDPDQANNPKGYDKL